MTVGTLFFIAGGVLLGEIILAGGLSGVRRLGGVGARVSDALCRAPLLDVVVAVVTIAPWMGALVIWSWAGMAAAIVGQVAAAAVWVVLHELAHREAARGRRLVKAQNAIVGRVRNHAALWISVLALPVFWLVRIAEIFFYPPMCWLVGLPRYRHGEWVNVSRHKFDGLVGHDLIWCLYCDWMTGVYSLAGEMLRNVESFWCPIRFYDGKKCENCRIDFPDIEGGWAPADGGMADVESVMQQHYGPEQPTAWFGHPARLTVDGRSVDTSDASD